MKIAFSPFMRMMMNEYGVKLCVEEKFGVVHVSLYWEEQMKKDDIGKFANVSFDKHGKPMKSLMCCSGRREDFLSLVKDIDEKFRELVMYVYDNAQLFNKYAERDGVSVLSLRPWSIPFDVFKDIVYGQFDLEKVKYEFSMERHGVPDLSDMIEYVDHLEDVKWKLEQLKRPREKVAKSSKFFNN